MMAVLGYNDGGIRFYHFMIPETDLDSRLLPRGTDQEVIQLARVRMKRKSVGSCSKKLDLNEPANLSKLIVPYEHLINKKHSVDRESDPFRGYSLRITKIKEMLTQGMITNQKGMLIYWMIMSGSKESVSEGAWSEASRSKGNRTDDSSEDEDFFVDLENIVDDVDVHMKYFHIHVDEYVEWIQKTTKEASGSGVDFTEGEDLEFIDPESFDSPIVGEDNNGERMLKDIGKTKACSEGVVHLKAFTLEQNFKTKKDVKDYINKHVVETKRDLHFEKKNEKIRIRAKCRGVVPDMMVGHGKSQGLDSRTK
ncbi:unnamed protein product [Lactuca saligna]|uniref:Uncharacterized protein n=1 Tax=Lactuca saligna TaxID=75948 RepID=A0AA35Y2Y1_LACSI|nr:unnamed protein product [Lactuca saligna]